jgi:hypothetical protein
MDHSASLSAPARRTRRIVLSLAILGVAIAAFVVQRPLVASAPSSSSAEVGQSTSSQTALDEGDGVIPDGVAVSVFDEEIPAVGKLDPDLLDAYGLCQSYGNEPWHYELRPDAVDDGCPPIYADPTEDPRMLP